MAVIQKEIRSGGVYPRHPEPMDFGTAESSGRQAPALRSVGVYPRQRELTARERVSLNFHLDGYRFSDEFMLIPGLSEPALIGAATLQKWRLKLNFETDEVIVDPKVTKLRLLNLKNW